MSINISEHIAQIIEKTKEELCKAEALCEDYEKKFPQNIRQGLLCFGSITKKDVANYYLFVASLSRIVSAINSHHSNIAYIIFEADKSNDSCKVIICNELLQRCEEFESNVNKFAFKCEKIFTGSTEPAQYSKIYLYYRELRSNIKLYVDSINSIPV